MFKNIFRHRRRSKNEPLNDENEPITRIGSQSKAHFSVDTHLEWSDLSSEHGKDQQRNLQSFQLRSTENVSSATDVRSQHFNTEYINRAASSSQVTGRSGKYVSGYYSGKRHRLSSVVNKILMTRTESKPTPTTRRMVASGGFWTSEQSNRSTGIQASDKHYDEDTDSVFTLPYSCQCCTGTAQHGDTTKNWTCSHCRMQTAKGRDRHMSTESSPAALGTSSIDSVNADKSEPLCQQKDFSYEKYNRNFNPHCSHDSSSGNCMNAICGPYYPEENVSNCDGTPYHRNASTVPSPLRVDDLECHESELDGDDDVVPELVEISPQPRCSSRSCTDDAGHDKQHSPPVVQSSAETEAKIVNESQMYILTDSFLDDSFASFMHPAAARELSHLTTVRRLPDVMVADDYQVMYPSKTNYGNTYSRDSSTKPACLLVVSPHSVTDAKKSFPQPTEKAEIPDEQTWCRKSLLEWSTEDVLHWVVSVGLEQFYDTFSSKLLHYHATYINRLHYYFVLSVIT